MNMNRSTALRILSLTDKDLSPDAVRTAYRRAAKAAHPDAGGTGDQALLQQARDRLLDEEPAPLAGICPMCRGSGYVRGNGLMAQLCVSCGGTGLMSY